MSEIEIKRAAANSVMRIEICLPRVFPWKLRGGARPPTEVINKVLHHIGGEPMKHFLILIVAILTLCANAGIASSADVDDSRRSVVPANATISFGQWQTDPALDRLNANPMGGAGNNHELIPDIVTIEAGGAVNFVISGFHNVQIFDDGTKPDDIGTTVPPPLPGMGGGIIDDANNRIYRGWDPNPIPNNFQRDRVEAVHFAEPGRYLVICGVVNHFVNDRMYGFVRVVPEAKGLF
jgi:plastocyanin